MTFYLQLPENQDFYRLYSCSMGNGHQEEIINDNASLKSS